MHVLREIIFYIAKYQYMIIIENNFLLVDFNYLDFMIF
jgi:hypothetical protein